MNTRHNILYTDSSRIDLRDESVDLIVTSPPYPMIGMWDDYFSISGNNLQTSFDLAHTKLFKVWEECIRVLKKGGFLCINIGDGLRAGEFFRLWPNVAWTQYRLSSLTALPAIIWHKQTNAPNKFMGSGMLPAGSYVTLEHEYILIFRKGGRRLFNTSERALRRESAFFWEERNVWFSDLWAFKGIRQNRDGKKVAAYPFELPYRLINMYSIKGDTVLDPFLGTATTMLAAMASERNSIGIETNRQLKEIIQLTCMRKHFVRDYIKKRLLSHIIYTERSENFKYMNKFHRFAVKTSQETDLIIRDIRNITISGENSYEVTYMDAAHI